MRDYRIHASQEITKACTATGGGSYVCTSQSLGDFGTYQSKIADCDRQIQSISVHFRIMRMLLINRYLKEETG